MAKLKVESTKTERWTNRVLAHDGRAGLLVVDKEGVQEVVDHPRVRQLIAEGSIKQTTGKVAEAEEDPEATRIEQERVAAEEEAAANAKAEQERLDAEAKAAAAAEKAKK